jgi:hypothetical protein
MPRASEVLINAYPWVTDELIWTTCQTCGTEQNLAEASAVDLSVSPASTVYTCKDNCGVIMLVETITPETDLDKGHTFGSAFIICSPNVLKVQMAPAVFVEFMATPTPD